MLLQLLPAAWTIVASTLRVKINTAFREANVRKLGISQSVVRESLYATKQNRETENEQTKRKKNERK